MGVEKFFMDQFFKRLSNETFTVEYWDQDRRKYGKDESKFTIVFHKAISKKKILEDSYLAFGEAYMDGDIDFLGNIREVLEAVYKNKQSFLNESKIIKRMRKDVGTSISQQKKDIHYHYDLGNDFYKLWLDETMSYSCGYFKTEEDSLYEAQMNKIHYILKKLQLKKGQRLLDIGSGWGWLIIEAAKKYGVEALGITLSEEQYKKTKERIKKENLEQLVDVKLMDYRELVESKEKFHRVVSVGMIEHVGRANLDTYMKAVYRLLRNEGISLLHCITGQIESEVNNWIKKYIFPGGYIPSIRELVWMMPNYNLHLIDMESLRLHYFKTLKHWAKNFEENIDQVRNMYDERFIRMWRMYLNGCAASFHHGSIDVHQFLFTKGLNNQIPITRECLYK
ncbi:SAM-dependent methyltransferase [Inediibacterium massiliense]|uniref:SAM-dependent methyltransferase n=1 Tax=Inediibacterium massiliense TaxID=1658111 RepID=UPI0006B5A593|nr:cyclopropane-fatty-acyl-phospholipid synthase family protein [Inediibacterium massiliense]